MKLNRLTWRIAAMVIAGGMVLGRMTGCGGGDGEDVTLSPEDQADFDNIQAAATVAQEGGVEFERLVESNVDNPVAALIEYLRNDPRVASAVLSPDGGTVIVTSLNGEQVSIITDAADRPDWVLVGTLQGREEAAERPPRPPQPQPALDESSIMGAGSIICDPTTYPQSSNAILLTAFEDDFKTGDEFKDDMSAFLERSGYKVTRASVKTVEDIEELQTQLANSGVIYASSHGNVGVSRAGVTGNVFATEIRIDDEASLVKLKRLFGDKARDYVALGSVGKGADKVTYIALTPAFFASIRYKNSLVFMDACHSDSPVGENGAKLRDAFQNNGAGAFLGWQDAVHADFSKSVTRAVLSQLSPAQVSIASVTLSANPPDPAPRQSYVPSAVVSPAMPVELSLSVSGTDGYSRNETKTTGADGTATFASVPGGQGGVVDTLTISAGGADSTATAVSTLNSNPAVQEVYKLKYWSMKDISVRKLANYSSDKFNIVCNNLRLTDTKTVVKF